MHIGAHLGTRDSQVNLRARIQRVLALPLVAEALEPVEALGRDSEKTWMEKLTTKGGFRFEA